MQHRIASREEWLAARRQHLIKEKELTRPRDQLSAERRALPWVRHHDRYGASGFVDATGRYRPSGKDQPLDAHC